MKVGRKTSNENSNQMKTNQVNKIAAVILYILCITTINAQDIQNGLVAYWPLDGNALDASGNVKNGSISGVVLASDRFNEPLNAYSFDGIDDRIYFGDITLTDASYSFWINPSALTAANGGHMDIIESYHYWSRIYLNNGNIAIELDVNGQEIQFDQTLIEANKWQHIVLTRTGGTAKFYFNGVLVETKTNQSLTTLKVDKLGRADDYRAYKGSMDEVRIYNREISAEEVSILYAEVVGSPWSLSNNNLLYNEGNVGIGTTNPLAPLQVNPQGGAGIVISENSATGGFTGLEIGVSQQQDGYSYLQSVKSSGSEMGDLVLLPGNTGNVGIGTIATPDAKLTVKGDIHTQEVNVDLLGAVAPDFVFEEDYELKSLEETEEYIKTNKHLPEIPSASEMEENGLGLKEMNLKLLQKVEELTLHLIQQNKDLKNQGEEIKSLKEEVAELRTKR